MFKEDVKNLRGLALSNAATIREYAYQNMQLIEDSKVGMSVFGVVDSHEGNLESHAVQGHWIYALMIQAIHAIISHYVFFLVV